MKINKKSLRKLIRQAYNQGAVDMESVFRPQVTGVSAETQIHPDNYDLGNRAVPFGFVRNEENK